MKKLKNKIILTKEEEITKILTCGICLGILRNPHRFEECIDVFCKSCINKYSENIYNKNCPKCQVDLGGNIKEKIIFHPIYDNIIKALFPEFEEIDSIEKV
jgi:E3 ubiquitin-protein ligase RNF1/2